MERLFEEDLASIKAPFLIVQGEHDFVRLEHSVETVKLIPHAELAVIPNASHFALSKMPEIISPLTETPVRSALDLIESLVVEGIMHGHFDYSLTCELGTNGRRLLIVKAGKSHKFTIEGIDFPR